MSYIEWLLLILLPVILFSLIAQVMVKSSFKKYSKIQSKSGWTANEMVKMLMERYDVNDLIISKTTGKLTDNFNPKSKVLSLSDSVYNSDSIAALGVAAHEMGHAVQHNKGYLPLRFRSILVPIVNIGSRLAFPLIIVGIIISLFAQFAQVSNTILIIGLIAYSLSTVFALCTLPVEIDASRRARKMLLETGVVDQAEASQVKSVLNAAALTYVASLAVSIAYLIRMIMIVSAFKRK